MEDMISFDFELLHDIQVLCQLHTLFALHDYDFEER